MKRTLTDAFIRSIQHPDKGQVDYWDTLPGFGLRVSVRSKTFIVLKHGNRRTLGRYPHMTLAEARQKAVEPLRPRKPALDYPEAVERFLRQREGILRPYTLGEYRRILTTNPIFGPVDDIRQADVLHKLDEVKKDSTRQHLYAVYKLFFNWCVEREYMDDNPLRKVKKPKVTPANERILSDTELAKIWHACGALKHYGLIVRILMLTGQRANQIASLQSKWIDHDKKIITFPKEIMKNNRQHFLPISSATELCIFQATPHDGHYFSPSYGPGRPFSGWSKYKTMLDAMVDIDPWVIHDLRRTWSTNAARLAVLPHITERILSHAQPEGKVAAIYNRFLYLDEMRAAMDKMNSHILELVVSDPISTAT